MGPQVRVLREPIAAAMAYGVGAGGDETVLVVDLGGGTFDVSVLEAFARLPPPRIPLHPPHFPHFPMSPMSPFPQAVLQEHAQPARSVGACTV